MSQETIARRYARALFELGKESGTLPQVVKDIASFAAVYAESEDLRNVLGNPLVKDGDREAILKEVATRLGVSDLGMRSLRLLLKNRRLVVLPELFAVLTRLYDDDAGVLRATVASAGPLSSAYLDRLRAQLEKSTGKKVVIKHEVDSTLIAGVVTRIGDKVIDGSVRAKLAGFRHAVQAT